MLKCLRQSFHLLYPQILLKYFQRSVNSFTRKHPLFKQLRFIVLCSKFIQHPFQKRHLKIPSQKRLNSTLHHPVKAPPAPLNSQPIKVSWRIFLSIFHQFLLFSQSVTTIIKYLFRSRLHISFISHASNFYALFFV